MADPPPPARKGNVLTQKAGPLPVWAWGLGGAVLVAGYIYYRKAKAAASTSTTPTATGAVNPQTGYGMSGYGWGDGSGGGAAGGSSAPGPVSSPTPGAISPGLGGQAVPPTYTTLPTSPNGTAVPTIGSSGQPIGVPQPGDVFLPQPQANNFGGTQATAANLGPGQSGILPNGLRVTRSTDKNGNTLYTYS